MKLRLKVLLGTLVIAASSVTGISAQAQRIPDPNSWSAALDNAFNDSGNIYDSQTTVGNLRTMFGTGAGIFRRGNYPEIAIERDSRRIERLYRQLLQDQVASDPELRVIDLPNPFRGSLLTEPSVFSRQASGTEFVYERSPF